MQRNCLHNIVPITIRIWINSIRPISTRSLINKMKLRNLVVIISGNLSLRNYSYSHAIKGGAGNSVVYFLEMNTDWGGKKKSNDLIGNWVISAYYLRFWSIPFKIYYLIIWLISEWLDGCSGMNYSFPIILAFFSAFYYLH